MGSQGLAKAEIEIDNQGEVPTTQRVGLVEGFQHVGRQFVDHVMENYDGRMRERRLQIAHDRLPNISKAALALETRLQYLRVLEGDDAELLVAEQEDSRTSTEKVLDVMNDMDEHAWTALKNVRDHGSEAFLDGWEISEELADGLEGLYESTSTALKRLREEGVYDEGGALHQVDKERDAMVEQLKNAMEAEEKTANSPGLERRAADMDQVELRRQLNRAADLIRAQADPDEIRKTLQASLNHTFHYLSKRGGDTFVMFRESGSRGDRKRGYKRLHEAHLHQIEYVLACINNTLKISQEIFQTQRRVLEVYPI